MDRDDDRLVARAVARVIVRMPDKLYVAVGTARRLETIGADNYVQAAAILIVAGVSTRIAEEEFGSANQGIVELVKELDLRPPKENNWVRKSQITLDAVPGLTYAAMQILIMAKIDELEGKLALADSSPTTELWPNQSVSELQHWYNVRLRQTVDRRNQNDRINNLSNALCRMLEKHLALISEVWPTRCDHDADILENRQRTPLFSALI